MIQIIAGPTASGKSSYALDIASKKGFTILNADALQLYKGLPLLTACPSAEDLEKAPHKLYECLNPFMPISAADWVKKIEEEIKKENEKVILVGGSGFYIKALTEGLSPIPEVPESIRAGLNERLAGEGLKSLYTELQRVDSEVAVKIMPADKQRICRALEVYEATGQKLSDWHKVSKIKTPYDFDITLLMPERKILYERCNKRFLKMIDQGVVDEVKDFMCATNDVPNALVKSLGYAEIKSFIKGEITKKEAINLAQIATRQFAKRQMTWFRWQIKDKKRK